MAISTKVLLAIAFQLVLLSSSVDALSPITLFPATLLNTTYGFVEQAWVSQAAATGQVVGNFVLVRAVLPPCAGTFIHIHDNSDELTFCESGKLDVASFYINGTQQANDTLTAGMAFPFVQHQIHTVFNNLCDDKSVLLSFFNNPNPHFTNVGVAYAQIIGSPLSAYISPDRASSITSGAAFNLPTYNPACLKRCKLGTVGGVQPAL